MDQTPLFPAIQSTNSDSPVTSVLPEDHIVSSESDMSHVSHVSPDSSFSDPSIVPVISSRPVTTK